MIDRVKGEFRVQCDGEGCGAELFGGVTDDFREFVAEIKAQGWVNQRTSSGEWEHMCPDCQDDVEVVL